MRRATTAESAADAEGTVGFLTEDVQVLTSAMAEVRGSEPLVQLLQIGTRVLLTGTHAVSHLPHNDIYMYCSGRIFKYIY